MDVMQIARFWSKVRVSSDASRCWWWMGGTDSKDRPSFKVDGVADVAARVAYRMAHGEIPEGLVVRHRCDNHLCCNPTHLEIGTHADNVQDRVDRDRSAKGEKNGRSKLTDNAVRLIRESPLSAAYFARRFEVDPKVIADVRAGNTWKHVQPTA